MDSSDTMVKRPPSQTRGKRGHFMPQFDSHLACSDCRANCNGQHPCVQGTDVTQCSTLSEEELTRFRENIANRLSYRNCASSQGDNEEPETEEELVFTSEELSQVDDTLLDLELEQSILTHLLLVSNQ